MTTKEMTILALLGFGVWVSGAVTFKFGGGALFENGPWVLAASAVAIALAVCLVLRSIMDWRKAPISQSVTVAVIMTLGGLFGDVAYILGFHRITGLSQVTAGAYAAVVIFATAVLFTYALVRQTRAGVSGS
ncbi:DUF5367 family protein [Phenylobacterium sp.]|uniref:DUF5367 family protein n=1 Tax=Phenylobacterium sp. TaxID=1871053 RepID=UPI00374CA308